MAHNTSFAILRVAKLRTLGNVAASGAHTWRERETPNADAVRTSQNRTLGARGSAELVAAVQSRHSIVTEKKGADSVAAIEILATASPKWWQQATKQQVSDFFERAAAWIQNKFGRENVVSMTIHLDETSPHLVGYVVPVVEVAGKTRKRSVIVGTNPDGSKQRETREFQAVSCRRLSAAHWLDGREKLSNMQTEFADEMQALGLRRGLEKSRARHQTIKQWYARINQPVTPLPGVKTTTPQPMPPEPPKPGLLASRDVREAYKAWQQEADRRDRQRRQHLAERAKQGAAAVALVRELEPKARERDQAMSDRHRLELHADGLRDRAKQAEKRAAKAEAVLELFSPEEIEQRRRERQQQAEAAKQAEREAAQKRELQFIKQRREAVMEAEKVKHRQADQRLEREAEAKKPRRSTPGRVSGPSGP